jgi:biotin carboxyl carrier protein
VKLNLAVNGVKQQIEILVPAPGCRFRLGRGPERSADVATPEPGVYSVLLDGRSYDVRVERTIGNLIVFVQGHRFEIEVRDPRRWSPNAASRRGADIETISAPMPGKVVRVLVAPGDTVEAGQGVMVVEAMKMQNEMKASRTGLVLAVAAKEGATVTAGEVLATIGSPAPIA